MTRIKYDIEFTYTARDDLMWLYNRLEVSTNRDRANRMLAGILERIEILKTFPYLGAVEQSLTILGLGHRYLVKGNHKVVYRIEAKKIIITDIFNARQNPDNLLNRKL